MGAGGVIGRGALAATRLGQMGSKGAVVAGALGEGAVMAGSQAEGIRQETDDGLLTPGQAGAALATGAIGAGLGYAGGKLANKLGVGNAETMLAQGTKGLAKQHADEAVAAAANPLMVQAAKGIPRQVIEGALVEGVFEELPQSVTETIIQNLALDKPWSEGLDEAIVLGVLSGGAMGAGAAGYKGFTAPKADENKTNEAKQAADKAKQEQEARKAEALQRVQQAWQQQAQLLAEQEAGEPEVPQTAPSDAAAMLAQQRAQEAQARQAEIDAGRAMASPDDEIYESTGTTMRPSEAMGLNPTAGGLEGAAALAVDTVASAVVQAAAQYIDPDDMPDAGADAPLSAASAVADTAPEDPFAGYERDYDELSDLEKELYDWEMTQREAPDEAFAALAELDDSDIPFFDRASNATDEDFLRALGASDEEIADALTTTNQSASTQSHAASTAETQTNEPRSPRQSAGQGQEAEQVSQQLLPTDPAARIAELEAIAKDADAQARDWASRTYKHNPKPLPEHEAKGGPADVGEANEQRRLKAIADAKQRAAEARAEITRLQEQGNTQAQLAAKAPSVADLAAISRKQIPDMTDAELVALASATSPEHGRFKKLQKALQSRGLQAQAATNKGATENGTQASQTQQAGTQQQQAGAAAGQAAKQGAVNGGATTGNNGAQASQQGAAGSQEAIAAISQEGNARREAERARNLEASERWTRMTTLERQAAIANAKGLNPIQRKNLHTRAWADMTDKTRAALLDTVAPMEQSAATESSPEVSAPAPKVSAAEAITDQAPDDWRGTPAKIRAHAKGLIDAGLLDADRAQAVWNDPDALLSLIDGKHEAPTPAEPATAEAPKAEAAPAQATADTGQPGGYTIRTQERRNRIDQAKTPDEVDAIVREEEADPERHFEGVERVLSAARNRRSELDREAASQERERLYRAGEWMPVDERPLLVRAEAQQRADELQAQDPQHEYRVQEADLDPNNRFENDTRYQIERRLRPDTKKDEASVAETAEQAKPATTASQRGMFDAPTRGEKAASQQGSTGLERLEAMARRLAARGAVTEAPFTADDGTQYTKREQVFEGKLLPADYNLWREVMGTADTRTFQSSDNEVLVISKAGKTAQDGRRFRVALNQYLPVAARGEQAHGDVLNRPAAENASRDEGMGTRNSSTSTATTDSGKSSSSAAAPKAEAEVDSAMTPEEAARYLKDFVYSLGNLDGMTDSAQIELSSPLGKSGRDTLLMEAFGISREQAHEINNRLDASKPRKLRREDMQEAFDVFPSLRKLVSDAIEAAAKRDSAKAVESRPAKAEKKPSNYGAKNKLVSLATKQANAAPSTSKTPAIDKHNAFIEKLREGNATPEQFRAAFEELVAGKATILAELATKTKAQLLADGGPYLRMRYSSEKKADVVDAVYREMLGQFNLGDSLSYGIGPGAYEAALRRVVESTDEAKIAQYAENRKAFVAAQLAALEERAQAVKDPKTLNDFGTYVKAKMEEGMTRREAFLTLTPEQRIAFDTLAAESTRARRESKKAEAKAAIRAAGQTTEATIIETKHTRDGYDLFVVQLADRLSSDDYRTVLASAKNLGGWYSSFRGNGATPGFQFKDRASAEAFLKLAGGDTSTAAAQVKGRIDAYEDDKSQTAAQRLSAMADKMESDADAELNRDRKANTARRASMARAALEQAGAAKALAKTMRNIAKAIEGGKAKFLDAIRTKKQVEMLASYIRTAKDAELRSKYSSYEEQMRRRGEPATAETADFADFPTFSAFRSDLAILARQMLEVDGTKKLGQRLMQVADDVSDAYMEFAKANLRDVSAFGTASSAFANFSNKADAETAIRKSGLTGKAIVLPIKRGENRVILSPSEAINRKIWDGDNDKRITLAADFGSELVQAIGRRGDKQNRLTVPWQLQTAYDKRKALSAIGIETASEFRSALREFISLQEQASSDRVRELELSMAGRKKDGLDFFPTPQGISDQMIEAADLSPKMSVLEPSAGMGHLADRIRAAGVEPDVIEMSSDRRELLEEKGYTLLPVNDFLDLKPREFFTYGDVFRAQDGTEGIMRGSGGIGSQRVRLEDEQGNELGLYNRDELTGVRHRGADSGYDRIIMNPPFSNRRDAEHVRHAFTLLKPGGRIVAIMGEGVFFGQDKKAQEFREWLDSVGGTSEKLPEGSFMDSDLPVTTAANARMVVIDKSTDASQTDDAGNGSRPVVFSQNLLSPAPSGPKPTPDQIQRLADKVQQLSKGGFFVRVTSSPVNVPGVKVPAGAKPTGAVIDGNIYLFADNLSSIGDAYVTLFHEIFHLGLQRVLPAEDYAALLKQFASNPLVANFVRQWKSSAEGIEKAAKMPSAAYDALATEEALAMISEELSVNDGVGTRSMPGLVKKMLSWFAQVSDKLGFPANFSNWVRNLTRTDAEQFVSDMTRAVLGGPKNLAKTRAKYGSMAAEMTAQNRLRAPGGADQANTEAERQFKETERAYGGRAAYDKAKAEGETKLTYGQWAQVRTPNFKEWFGDWEAVRTQQRLDAMKPVQVRVPDAWRGLGNAELRQKMAEELDRMVREKVRIEHPDLGEIRVGRAGAKKTQSTSKDPAKIIVAADLENILPAALHARSNAPVEKEQGVNGYSTLLARVEVDGHALVASFSIRQQQDGAWYYNTVALHDAKEKAQDSYGSPGALSRPLGETPIAGLSDFIRRSLARVNPDEVSKVTDPATGEPLVVYHGSTEDIRQFNTRGYGDEVGAFFATNPASLDDYTDGEGGNVTPVYLAVRKTYEVTEKQWNNGEGLSPRDARDQGYDGYIIRGQDGGDTYIAFRPEQIKSATGNNGNFDPANPDIANYAANPTKRPGSAQDKAVMQAIADGKSARDVLRLIANQSKDPFRRQVARLLLKAGITPNIQFGHIGKDKKGNLIHGQYRGQSDTILIAGSAEYAAERIFLHEAMHAATMRALAKPGLLRLQLQKLLEHVRKQGGAAGFYGLKNVDEFVVEVFTNRDFQRALRNMNAPSGSALKTAWDGFVRILRSILGLSNNSTNALSQALSLGVAAVREDMVLRKQGARADRTANFGADDFAKIKTSALDQIHKIMSHPGKVSLWDKTVGTMRHIAERYPAFKPVFDAAQQFLDDVASVANEAADMAPRLIPRVDTMRDMLKKPISVADNRAIGKALFSGTLDWGRDQHGKAMPMNELRAKYANLSVDTKSEILMASGKVQPQVIAMWRGKELAQYETLINNKFESTILKSGVRFSHEELRKFFNLNEQQISLYDEARATVDKSLDLTARAEMLRKLGRDWDFMRDMVMDAPTLTEAWKLLHEELEQRAKEIPDSRDQMAAKMFEIRASFDKAQELMEHGYMPLQRFGKYTVDVVDENGERVYFSMFESKAESNKMAQALRREYPNARVVQGTMNDQQFKLFAGITPETAELFGSMLGLDADGQDAKDQAFQEYLKLAKNNHSALKRLIHRKGIAGYSEDVGRVLASFVYSNARLAATGLNAGKMEQAINTLQTEHKEQGELGEIAAKLRSYIQDPQEEGHVIRGMLFAQYLGGSVASAAVNMTQPFAVTLPWLTQYGGMAAAGRYLAGALRDMAKRGHKYEADLAHALKMAEDDGVVSPQEIHQLMAQARGAGGLRTGDGTKLGDARAQAANLWEKVKVGWGQPFALAEQFNRRSTFIAAYRLAKDRKLGNPAEFARRAVLETQFLYSKANKPQWARGAVGGTLFTFKTYSVSFLELMHRMWTQGGPEGKRAVGWAMAMLLLMGGAGGLPFMEDLEDLIDGAGQMMGYNVSAKQWRQQLLRDVLGAELAGFIEQGMSGLPGAPVDVSGRLGMGNLIPGTGLLLDKQSNARDVVELLGPAGDLVQRGMQAVKSVASGVVNADPTSIGRGVMEVMPTAVRNAAKGVDMAASGIYKDTKGYKVIDTTLDEAVAKFLGFQPRSVAEVQEANSFMQRAKSFYIQTSNEIKAQWAKALFEKDAAGVERARQRVKEWNEKNPDQPIRVNMRDIWERVRQMGKDRTARIADTAPKALRQQLRDMAQEQSR